MKDRNWIPKRLETGKKQEPTDNEEERGITRRGRQICPCGGERTARGGKARVDMYKTVPIAHPRSTAER
jgi:hypothetical protein